MLDPTATAELVGRALGGDARAFDGLARAWLRPAYAVALSLVERPADAEDIAQEAVVAALELLDDCREPRAFGTWLLRSVRHRALNWLQHRRHADVPAEAPTGDEAATGGDAEQATLRRHLLAALDAVTPIQREVVLLHDLEGWSHAEIGAALEISEVGSRQHLFQARRALRGRLTDPPLPEATP